MRSIEKSDWLYCSESEPACLGGRERYRTLWNGWTGCVALA
jgi:hypothetical protein